jgi:hypothetical protein
MLVQTLRTRDPDELAEGFRRWELRFHRCEKRGKISNAGVSPHSRSQANRFSARFFPPARAGAAPCHCRVLQHRLRKRKAPGDKPGASPSRGPAARVVKDCAASPDALVHAIAQLAAGLDALGGGDQ